MGSKAKYRSLDLAIWNPFTRRYKKLPLCPVETLHEYRGFTSAGLRYDSAHDDYKIVMISKVHDVSQVWIFGLKSDFWRRSQDLEGEVPTSVGRFANGALYWLGFNKCVSFDLAKEELVDILLLSDCDPAGFFINSLVILGGNLYFHRWNDGAVELYLLGSDVSDNGGEFVGFSWRKEFSIENVEAFMDKVSLAFLKDRDSILLYELNGVFWHNLENKTKQRVNIAGLPIVHWFRCNVCWESLVSVGKHSAFD